MKIRIIKFALAISIAIANSAAMAYQEEFEEEICKKPKYTDFTLPLYKEPEKIEVAPESEFEFKISAWSDPKTIKLTARNEKIDFSVESTSTFHRVKARLPASLNGKFARINASVKAVLGCDEQAGWLVKVANTQAETSASVSQTATPTDLQEAQAPAAAQETPAAQPSPQVPVSEPQAAQ